MMTTSDPRLDGPSQQGWASAYWLIREIAVEHGLAEVGPDGILRSVDGAAEPEMLEEQLGKEA